MPVWARMRRPAPDPSWPASWKLSYHYDRMELFGEVPAGSHGYAYAYEARVENTLDLLQHAAPRGCRVLDVAAAQGNFTLRLAELGYDVTWNDLRADLADYVRGKWEKGSVHYVAGNALELLPEAAFDVVLIAEIIEHVAHPDEFLRRISTLVKPGGAVIMTTPNGEYFRNRLPRFSDCPDPSVFEKEQFKPDSNGHIFLLHEDEIRTLAAKAGLVVEELRVFTNPLTGGHFKLAKLLGYLPKDYVRASERFSRRAPGFLARKLHAHFAAVLRRPLRS